MYCIVQDDCAHRYVIPLSKRLDWELFLLSEDCELGDTPKWARGIDGEESICFPSYELIRERASEDEIGDADLDDGC